MVGELYFREDNWIGSASIAVLFCDGYVVLVNEQSANISKHWNLKCHLFAYLISHDKVIFSHNKTASASL